MYKFYDVKIQVRYEYEVADNYRHWQDPAFESHTEIDEFDGMIHLVAESVEDAKVRAELYDISVPEEEGEVLDWWVTDVVHVCDAADGETPDPQPDDVELNLPDHSWM